MHCERELTVKKRVKSAIAVMMVTEFCRS
jgi:hypothetical protein